MIRSASGKTTSYLTVLGFDSSDLISPPLAKIIFNRAGVWSLWALFMLSFRKKERKKNAFIIFLQKDVEAFL